MVRATFDDGTNVPRIPPVRAGGGVFWRDANWFARVNLLHAFAQHDIAPIGERRPRATISEGGGQLQDKLESDMVRRARNDGRVVGNNLLNENIHNCGVLQEGRGADARHRCVKVRQSEELALELPGWR